MNDNMADDNRTLAPKEFSQGLDDWRYLAGKLRARFRTRTFATGLSLIDQIAEEAEKANHHPDIDFRYTHVDIALISHDVRGITRRDVELARAISQIASRLGVVAEPGQLQVIALALDTADADAIRPFWQAVLGLRPEEGYDSFLFDPDGHSPGLFLQSTDPHEAPRQRFHVDIDVPPDAVQERISKALNAGGTLVSDEHAPAWWTLADSQGNQVDIATWEGRE